VHITKQILHGNIPKCKVFQHLAILSVLPVFWRQASQLISASANLPSSLPDPFLIKQPAHGGMSGRDPGKLTIEPAVLFSLYSLLISNFSVL
jgi:hypothetical protein